jgi:hypothetical protein
VETAVEPVRRKCDHNTPEDILDVFRRYKPIVLDPCSNPWSSVRAAVEYSWHRGENGLELPWGDYITEAGMPGQAFVNPDYAKIAPWIEKAADEARGGVESCLLVPCSPETRWSRLARTLCSAWGPWHKRIPFIGAGGQGAKQPSAVYHFGPGRYSFAHHFEDVEQVCPWVEVMPRRWGQE